MTRNKDKYHHGRMWLNYNKAFNNGINGLVVHKTDRTHVVGNVIWDNGQVMEILITIPRVSSSFALVDQNIVS